jgi:Nucleotidyl transferase AbiEii toxin, Type IV TA system
MPIDALHRTVAEIALRAAAQHGFALAGGNALIVHGLIDRETQDVDLFTNLESGVKAASSAVEAALRGAGYRIRPVDKTAGLADIFPGMGYGLAEWLITAPGGREMTLQMSYFDRVCEPVIMDIGPVLDLADLVGWKTVAVISRGSERDFVDLAAALDRYSIAELIAIARRLDRGLMDENIADAGRRLDALPDRVFARYGLSRRDVGRLRAKFAGWPRA